MGRRRESERAERFRRRFKLAHTNELKRETFYALENLRRASWPARIVGGALFVLILLNAVVVFVSAQPGLDPVTADVVVGFYRFSTVCFCVEYLARVWIADLAFGNCTPARARLRYICSPWGITDLLSFGPNMVAWFVPVTPVLLNVINVVRLVRLVKISRYMRGLRTIGRVIAKHYHEIVAAFLVIALLVVVSSVIMYEIEHPARQVQQSAVGRVLGRHHHHGYRLWRPGAHYAGRAHRGLRHYVPLRGLGGHSRRYLLRRLRGRVPEREPAQDRARRAPRRCPPRRPRRSAARWGAGAFRGKRDSLEGYRREVGHFRRRRQK